MVGVPAEFTLTLCSPYFTAGIKSYKQTHIYFYDVVDMHMINLAKTGHRFPVVNDHLMMSLMKDWYDGKILRAKD